MPHDPTGYLRRYCEILISPDVVALEYLKESLRNFASGCYLSANMMLGIASERIFLNLCEDLQSALKDPSEAKRFEKIMSNISMVSKFEFVRNKLESIMSQDKGAFPSNTKTALFGIAEFLRFQRNDIGHPQDTFAVPERDAVFVNLRIFPEYCRTVREIEFYLSSHKV